MEQINLEQVIYNSMRGLEKIKQKTNIVIMIPQSLLSRHSLDLLTASYQKNQLEQKKFSQTPDQMLLKVQNIQAELTKTSNPSWEVGLKSPICEISPQLQMDRQQINTEVQLNHSSTVPSKLLPVKNLIIDLSEQWEYHNMVIARIVLTQYVQFTKIVAIPQFLIELPCLKQVNSKKIS